MTPQALNKFLSEFLITVRKKEHNEEYEPNSLIQRHSKKNILWTLPYEKRPVRANSESASVKAKGSKTERHRQMCSRGDVKLFQNFHRAGVPRIQ